jgi:hypothetical protein
MPEESTKKPMGDEGHVSNALILPGERRSPIWVKKLKPGKANRRLWLKGLSVLFWGANRFFETRLF